MGEMRLKHQAKVSARCKENIDTYRPSYQLEIKKKLNPLAYVILGSLYTLAIVLTTLKFNEDDKRYGQVLSAIDEKIKKEILHEVKKMNHGLVPNIAFDQKINNHLEKFRLELIEEINRLNFRYIEMAENKTVPPSNIISELRDRSPASEKIKNGKAIPYNLTNRKVLYFMHQKELKSAEAFFSEKKAELLETLNLSSREDQRKLKKFEDEAEIAIYELKQKQYQQRRDFELKKYIVVKSNF